MRYLSCNHCNNPCWSQPLAVDLNRLQLFREVVLAGSFTKAATKLRQPKSRVSRQVAALERELGVQLVYRTTRQFRLTPAGQELFLAAAPLLGDLADTLERVTRQADAVAGPLRVSFPEDFGVELAGDLCHEFLVRHPQVRLDVHVSNQTVDLVRDGFDLALRVGRLGDSSLRQRRVGDITMALVIGTRLWEERGRPDVIAALETLPYLAFAPRGRAFATVEVPSAEGPRTLELSPLVSSTNLFVLRSMAIAGAGVTGLPPFLARRAVAEGQLRVLGAAPRPEATPIQIVMPPQREPPARVRAFADFLAETLAAVL